MFLVDFFFFFFFGGGGGGGGGCLFYGYIAERGGVDTKRLTEKQREGVGKRHRHKKTDGERAGLEKGWVEAQRH